MKTKLIILITVLLSLTASAQLTQEQRTVAMTLLGEARGEGKAGMYAVACVIAQRSINRRMTPRQVCMEDWQFSCWNKNDPNRVKLPTLLQAHPMRHYAIQLALNMNKLDRRYTNYADHYINPTGIRTPDHLKGKKAVRSVGKHLFYRLKKIPTDFHKKCIIINK
jgi:spore germination cell wall hydrolase CwlJ-like protein